MDNGNEMPGKERRRSPRFPVEHVSGTLHLSVPARIVNLGVSGMAVEVASPLRVGRTYAVRLRHGDHEELTLQGTVVWCHLRRVSAATGGERRPIYEAGVKFDDTLAPAATKLLAFLERSAVLDADKRIFGRFRIAGEASVRLGSEHEFTARTISAHGMLVETDVAVAVGTLIEVELHMNGEVATLAARIAFVRDVPGEGEGRRAELGVEYLELSPEAQQKIADVLARLVTT